MSVGQEELPYVATNPNAIAHIDFEFQMPYHESLNNKELLCNAIASAMSDILSKANSLNLSSSDVEISELDLRPNETNPQRIKIAGWFSCQDVHRKIYMDTLNHIHKTKKLSKQIADDASVKRSKVSIQQFTNSFSNAHYLKKSLISDTERVFDRYQVVSKSLTSLGSQTQTQSQQHVINVDENNENNNNDDLSTTPTTNIIPSTESFIVHDGVDHDEPFLNGDSNNDNHDDDNQSGTDSFQMVDAPNVDDNMGDDIDDDNNDGDDIDDEPEQIEKIEEIEKIENTQTNNVQNTEEPIEKIEDDNPSDEESNDEQKSKKEMFLEVDDNADLTSSEEDFSKITPRMPDPIHSPDEVDSLNQEQEVELNKLRFQLKRAKTQLDAMTQEHRHQIDDFQNKITKLKKEEKIRGISLQIDDEIMLKKIKHETEDKVHELESELESAEQEKSVSMKQLRHVHNNEINKIKIQLRKTENVHQLELNNAKQSHDLQVKQLRSQIYALKGAFKRESEKDRKIQELTEENEQLKSEKQQIISNYEISLEKLKNEYDNQMEEEINKRIKQTAKLRRDQNDLMSTLKREKSKLSALETDNKNLNSENTEKQSLITRWKQYSAQTRKKNLALEKKVNIYQQKQSILIEEEKQKERESKLRRRSSTTKDGHRRVPSNKLKNRTITIRNLDNKNGTVIEIEKKQDFDFSDLNFDDELGNHTDSDFDDDKDENSSSKNVKFIQENEHNEEIKLKEKEINSLKERAKSLESSMDSLKKNNAEEVSNLQQKIGSLQEQQSIEHENFLKQKQMLEYKLQREINERKKLNEKLNELQYSHKKNIRSLNDEILQLKQEISDKDLTIQSLEQHIDMLSDDNRRLKEMEQELIDYQEDFDDLENMYDALKRENETKEDQLNKVKEVILSKEDENEDLKSKVHTHSETISELEVIVKQLKSNEDMVKKKKEEIEQLQQKTYEIHQLSPRNSNTFKDGKRGSVQLDTIPDNEDELKQSSSDDDNNDDVDDNQSDDNDDHQGTRQADQPEPEPESERLSYGNSSYQDSLMNDPNIITQTELDKIQTDHAFEIEQIQTKNNQTVRVLKEDCNKFQNEINSLNDNNRNLMEQLKDIRNELKERDSNLKQAEEAKIILLTNFAKEMDRMRAEIRNQNKLLKLNGNRRR